MVIVGWWVLFDFSGDGWVGGGFGGRMQYESVGLEEATCIG